jgi:hypothetical protein
VQGHYGVRILEIASARERLDSTGDSHVSPGAVPAIAGKQA